MSKKDYKKGMSDAVEAYQGFGEKQEAATRYVAQETAGIAQKVDKLGDNIGEIVDYITDQEKAELYKLNTLVDIAELEDADKRILLAVLYQLSANEGDDLTEEQQNYIRAVQRYLEITNPQTETDLSVVERIESNRVQKAVLQAVLEFFRLGEHPEAFTEAQEEFLDYFQLNCRTRNEINEYIDKIVDTVGLEGLAEKYGFVPEPDTQNEGEKTEKPNEQELTLRKWNIAICLASGGLKFGEFGTISAIYHCIACKDITAELELSTVMDRAANPSPELVSAYQSGNLVGGFDTLQGDGLNSVYFLYTGLLIKNNGKQVVIEYSDITSLKTTENSLIIITINGSVSIYGNQNISRQMLKAMREMLVKICVKMPTFYTEDAEYTINGIIQSRLNKICDNDLCKPYAEHDLFEHSEKLKNALSTYAQRVHRKDVLAFIDTSLFSNGKDGILFSKTGIAFTYAFSKEFLRYDEIHYTELVQHKMVFHGLFDSCKSSYAAYISDSFFNLSELKACIDEICLYV